jgi:epoxyqueuosine reductase QueG
MGGLPHCLTVREKKKEINGMNLDGAIAEFIEKNNIPIFGITGTQGFAGALSGWHPKELMPKCESVIVMGHPLVEHPLHMEESTYIANRSWWESQRVVSSQINAWKGELFALLDSYGLGVASFGVFRRTTSPTFSYRIAQVEAGVGVYGCLGACINPEYGCYYRVGVLLTEAKLTQTNGIHLEGFNPCEGCSECSQVCPIKAIDASKAPGAGYDRERCARFIFKMSERSGTNAYICSQCYSVCPWSMGRLGTSQQNMS